MQKDRTENQLSGKLRFQRRAEQESLKSQVMGELSRRLKDMRKQEGAPETQAEIANVLEMSRSNLTKSFSRESNLSLSKIADLAAATGSECHFYLSPNNDPYWQDQSGELSSSANIKMMSVLSYSDFGEKQKVKTETELLDLARDFIREFLRRELNSNNENEIFDPSSRVTEGSLDIKVVKGRDITQALIVREYTFENGFSDVEWVLKDHQNAEHFRSRDLGLIARVLLSVIARGGFHI